MVYHPVVSEHTSVTIELYRNKSYQTHFKASGLILSHVSARQLISKLVFGYDRCKLFLVVPIVKI